MHRVFWFSIYFIIDGERDNPDYIKDKLNKTLFLKMQAIEAKRAQAQNEEKEPEKKLSRAEKKRIEMEKKWQEAVSSVMNVTLNVYWQINI